LTHIADTATSMHQSSKKMAADKLVNDAMFVVRQFLTIRQKQHQRVFLSAQHNKRWIPAADFLKLQNFQFWWGHHNKSAMFSTNMPVQC